MLRAPFASLMLLLAAPPLSAGSDKARGDKDGQTETLVCRSLKLVDSRIPQRVCHTPAEWAQIEHDTRETLDANRRNTGPSGDPG